MESNSAIKNSRSPHMKNEFNRDSIIIDKYRQKAENFATLTSANKDSIRGSMILKGSIDFSRDSKFTKQNAAINTNVRTSVDSYNDIYSRQNSISSISKIKYDKFLDRGHNRMLSQLQI